MNAVVGNLVWACLAGIAIALVLAATIAAIIRLQRPAAATRCALWFVALAACALAPLAIGGAMLVRGVSHPAQVASPAASGAASQNDDADANGDDAPAGAHIPLGVTHPRLHAALAGATRATRALRRPPSLTQSVALGIIAVWAAGALAGLIGLGRSLYRVGALKARSNPLDAALADDLPWLTEMPGREIYLRLSYEIETPIAIGFRRPVILIPTDMATFDGLQAIEPLVMHEYAHLARYDDWTNLVQRLIERIVWFNPLVWLVGRRLALEREVAADDAVVARTNDAKHYASTLWRMAREMRMPEHVVVAPGAMLTRKQISIRIERLLEDSRARRPHFGTAFIVVAVGACTVAAVAAGAPPIVLPPAAQPAPVAVAITTPAPVDAPSIPKLPNVPAIAWTPAFDAAAAQAQQSVRRAAATITRAVALAPHALPAGDLTRADVAACRTCDFSNRNLSGLDLSRLSFYGADFDGANLSDVDFTGARMMGVSMQRTNLSGTNFTDARMTGSRLEGADLSGAVFTNARFIGSTIDVSALHANGSLRSMVDGCAGCDFANADLHGQDLHGLKLDGANMQGADLHGANLRGSRLYGANVQDADLDHADLRDANLTGANLSGASMDGTVTTGAILTGATLP